MSVEIREIARVPLIIGGGVAGLMTALRLAPLPVVLLSKTPLGTEASSGWAQGGVAAAIGPDDDPALHCADTLAAGDGLCDPEIALRVTAAAPAAVEALCRYGVRFDCEATGALRLGLEAAHSRRRIVHAAGDGTGREIMRALTEAVRATPSITVLEGIEARRLLVADGAVTGVLAASRSSAALLPTGRIVIATGGVGGLFLHTTNPLGSFGQGLALAARAGAILADLEFVQFHPTALDAGPVASARPLPLVSEAVRGEGTTLIDETGLRFLATEPGQELAPRDVVARAVCGAIWQKDIAFLDARQALGAKFERRFPVIAAVCGRWDRSRGSADPDPSGRALPHGRPCGRRRRAEQCCGIVGVRRSRLHRLPWSKPAREQFAAGSDRRWRVGGGERRSRAAWSRPTACRTKAAAAGRPIRRAPAVLARGGRAA